MENIKLSKIFRPKFYSQKKRVGRNYDGGYVVSSKALKSSDILISFGLYDDWSFEEAFMCHNKKAKVIIFDGAIGIYFWIKYLIKNLIFFLKKKIKIDQLIYNYFQFIKFPFFILKRKVKFYSKYVIELKKNKKNKEITIEEISTIYYKKKLFFKIDIEGNEYNILDDIINIQNLIECLVIEFHDINKNLNTIQKFINNFDLKLIHVHVNNFGKINKEGCPSVVELTFTKKNYCKNKILKNFPIKNLDYPNNINLTDKKIKFIN